MRYIRSVITRLFTRVVGRVVAGYLPDPSCLGEASTHPKGQGMGSGRGFYIESVSILRTCFQSLVPCRIFTVRQEHSRA